MRFLRSDEHGNPCLSKDLTKDVPPYAILSHTWFPDEEDEVDYQDIKHGLKKEKIGHEKLRFCVQQAARDGLQFSWVDTCGINRSNEPELSQAIR